MDNTLAMARLDAADCTVWRLAAGITNFGTQTVTACAGLGANVAAGGGPARIGASTSG